MTRTLDLVVNPKAGAGRAARALGDVTRELALAGFNVDVHLTSRPGHAGELVRTLLDRSVPVIGIMGGDGTAHEAFGRLRDETGQLHPATATTSFALVPAGTGGDLRKTLGVPQEPRAIARYYADATPRAFDLGSIDYISHSGAIESRLFVNIASFGMSGHVDRIVNVGPKWLGGRAAFFVASLQALVTYRNQPVRVQVDGSVFYEGHALTVAIANGRAFGGGMFVAPTADPHDGLLDVVVLGDLSRAQSAGLSRWLYGGTVLSHPLVRHTRGRVVVAEPTSSEQCLLDVDGETPGRIAATFRVLPGAIRMLERA